MGLAQARATCSCWLQRDTLRPSRPATSSCRLNAPGQNAARARFPGLTDGDRSALPPPAAHPLPWKRVSAVSLKNNFSFNQIEIYFLTKRQTHGIRSSEDQLLS